MNDKMTNEQSAFSTSLRCVFRLDWNYCCFGVLAFGVWRLVSSSVFHFLPILVLFSHCHINGKLLLLYNDSVSFSWKRNTRTDFPHRCIIIAFLLFCSHLPIWTDLKFRCPVDQFSLCFHNNNFSQYHRK